MMFRVPDASYVPQASRDHIDNERHMFQVDENVAALVQLRHRRPEMRRPCPGQWPRAAGTVILLMSEIRD
jgi:hypothetical protein